MPQRALQLKSDEQTLNTHIPFSYRTPSLARRMACWIYESMLLFGVLFTTSYFFSVVTQTRHALDNRLAQQATLFFVLGLYSNHIASKKAQLEASKKENYALRMALTCHFGVLIQTL